MEAVKWWKITERRWKETKERRQEGEEGEEGEEGVEGEEGRRGVGNEIFYTMLCN